ncbi:MAG: 50S ribosomal protein L32 [Candidatus Pacebacteria bacterium]|nr:50S ribosomal protein L32 [Candidatus Paceibacterota bacterium]
MGGVPKQHKTKSSRNQRRMHIFAKAPSLTICPKCGKPVLPHNVCQNCGFYKGVEILNVLEKLTKKERKQREKELKAKEKGEKGEKSENSGKPVTWENLSKK